jgi:hypothetical protein
LSQTTEKQHLSNGATLIANPVSGIAYPGVKKHLDAQDYVLLLQAYDDCRQKRL